MSDVSPLSPPPKFSGQSNPNSPGPHTQRDWDEFIRWLFSLFRFVKGGGSIVPPPSVAPAIGGQSLDLGGTALTLGNQQQSHARFSGNSIPIPGPIGVRPVSVPIPAPSVQPPYPSQRGATAVLIDVYANWTAANYNPLSYQPGTQFVISNRSAVTYIIEALAGVNTWVYYAGTYIAALASLPTTGFDGAALGTNDAGLLFGEIAVYNHVIRWDGAVWYWGPGEPGSGAGPVLHEIDPGIGWALYDGSTVTYLKADGTTGSVALPDLTSAGALAAFLKGGGTNSGPTAASAPGVTGSTASGNAVIAPVTATTTAESSDLIFFGGVTTPLTAAGQNHTHDVTVSPTDSGHTHAKGTLAVDATGEPRKLVRRPFFRK